MKSCSRLPLVRATQITARSCKNADRGGRPPGARAGVTGPKVLRMMSGALPVSRLYLVSFGGTSSSGRLTKRKCCHKVELCHQT